MRRMLCAIGLLAVIHAPLVSADNVSAKSRLESFLADLHTLTAEFSQRVYDETGQPLEDSAGTVMLARPGKFRWNYLTPFQQTIISNGTKLWLYDAELAQVTVTKMDSTAAGSAAQLLGSDLDLDATYHIKEISKPADLRWLELTPKATNQQYAAVELGFDGAALRVMRLRDNLGQITELELTKVTRNQAVDTGNFEFAVPVGVDVIDGDLPSP